MEYLLLRLQYLLLDYCFEKGGVFKVDADLYEYNQGLKQEKNIRIVKVFGEHHS